MKDQFISRIGVHGQMHYQYLKETKPSVVNVMRMKRTLRSYLEEVNTNAEEMLAKLEAKMAKKEGVTEHLKAKNQMEWVRRMNSIRNRTEEVVKSEVLFI